MIVALESHEAGTRNTGRQFQSSLVRDATVIAAVNHERGYIHFRKSITNIHAAQVFLNSNRVLGRCGHTHQFIHPPNVLRIPVRYEAGSKHLSKRRIVLSPSVENQCLESLTPGDLPQIRTDSPAPRVPTMQDEMRHATGISQNVLDGDGATLRNSEQRKLVDSTGFDNRFQVANKRVEGKVLHVPIG